MPHLGRCAPLIQSEAATRVRLHDGIGVFLGTVTVQRIVFPAEFELPAPSYAVEALYLRPVSITAGRDIKGKEAQTPLRMGLMDAPEVLGRAAVRIPRGARLSTDTYFNRVNAGYWQRWTDLDALTIRVGGRGSARMVVRRSVPGSGTQPRTTQALESTLRVVEGDLSEGLKYDVSLDGFAGGGTLWVEIEPVDGDVVVEDARWTAETEKPLGRTDIGICTYNRPGDVLALLTSLRQDIECLEVIDQVWVVDNGTKGFDDEPGAPGVIQSWGKALHHIHQDNLGGSGGFARAQYEAAYNGSADFVMLLDDDVVAEPEGVRRAVVLASLSKQPIAVGGQMLNRADPQVLHSDAEWVKTGNIRYGKVPGGHSDVDLTRNRQEYVVDAAYNAWWCCLMPTEAIRKVGLGMPFFIKYDDVEYGYRMAQAGYRTVTMPGCAVWHEPFVLKDDTTDWMLYFHVRNRLIFAALMSARLPKRVQERRVGLVIRDIMMRDVLRNVLRRAYASAASAALAMEDFLAGPEILHEPLDACVERVRAYRQDYPDSETLAPSGGAGDRPTTVFRTKAPKVPLGLPRSVAQEFGLPVPFVLPIPPKLLKGKATADAWRIWEMPAPDGHVAELPKVADHWWGLVDIPDAWVVTVDGAKMTRRRRDPVLARSLTSRGWRLSREVKNQFAELAPVYESALGTVTSPHTWAKQFGIRVDQ